MLVGIVIGDSAERSAECGMGKGSLNSRLEELLCSVAKDRN